LRGIPEYTTLKYEEIKEALLGRFVEKDRFSDVLRELQRCTQKRDESVEDFGRRIKGFGIKLRKAEGKGSKNDLEGDWRGNVMLGQYLEGILPKFRRDIMRAKPVWRKQLKLHERRRRTREDRGELSEKFMRLESHTRKGITGRGSGEPK
jgi:hypothetical protein